MESSISTPNALGAQLSKVIIDLTNDFIDGKLGNFGDDEVQEIWLEIFYLLDDLAACENVQFYDLRSKLLISLVLIQLQEFNMYIVVFGILSDPEIGISGGPWYYFVIEIARYYLIYVVEQCQELKVDEKRRHLRAKIKEVEEKLNTIFVRHSFLRTKLTPIFNDINNLLDTIILDPVNSNDDESFEEDESCSDKEYYYIYAYKRQYPFEKFVPKILNWILHLLEDIDLNMQKQLSPVQSSSFSSNKSRANAGGAYNVPYIAQQDFDDRREIPLTQTFVISKRYSEASSSKRQSEASSSKRQSEATSSSHESSTRKQQKRIEVPEVQEADEYYYDMGETYDYNATSSWASPEYHSVTDVHEVQNTASTNKPHLKDTNNIANYLLDTIYNFYFENDDVI
jgi:hypothetical protein